MNNASLSSNTKTRPSSSRTHAQLPDSSCHQARQSLMAIHETAYATPNHSTNCFVYNIYPPNPTNIRSIQSHVHNRYTRSTFPGACGSFKLTTSSSRTNIWAAFNIYIGIKALIIYNARNQYLLLKVNIL